MTWFLLSIFCSTSLALVFKLSERYEVKLIHLIALNYLACALLGVFLSGAEFPSDPKVLKPAAGFAVLIGCMFIVTFYLLGSTTKFLGVTAAVIANKLSLIIPVIVGFVYYDDSHSGWKIAGIVLAFPAIFLATRKNGNGANISGKYLLLPATLFLASGFTDSIVKYAQHEFLQSIDFNFFLLFLFLTAGIISLVIVIAGAFKNGLKITRHEVVLGVLLGALNYGSIFFFIKTLNLPGLESSFVFPVNNMAIVALSALVAWAVFREKLNAQNIVGILLAVIAIALISLQPS